MLQLLHIYSVPTNEVLALPVTEAQQSSLSLKIQAALHIDRSDQELLAPTGTVADLNNDLSQYCLSQVLSLFTPICYWFDIIFAREIFTTTKEADKDWMMIRMVGG